MEDAIKPWQHRSGIFTRDPDFVRKAGVVLDLYHRTFEGHALRPNEYVLSADEKTSIQARCHPTLPPAQARAMRVEHEYDRGGALQYLAAWDCHRTTLFGRCEPRRIARHRWACSSTISSVINPSLASQRTCGSPQST